MCSAVRKIIFAGYKIIFVQVRKYFCRLENYFCRLENYFFCRLENYFGFYVNVDGDGNRKRGRSCFGGFIFISSPAQSDFRVGLAMSGMGLNFTRSMMMMMIMVMTMIKRIEMLMTKKG